MDRKTRTMDSEILNIKKLAENIQAAKLGRRGKEIHINSYTVIDEYQEWRTKSEDLFDKYFDESSEQYEVFKKFPRGGNGFELIGYFNQQLPIFNLLIAQIEKGANMIARSPNERINKQNTQGKSIFISHAVKDEVIVNAFVDLILIGALSISIDQIFSVSTDGAKIKSGSDWRDSIKENISGAKLTFLIITPNYKESEVCLNEMGAAWITDADVLPLIIEPINYKTVGVIQEPNQIEKMLDEQSLDRIRDFVQEKLEIPNNLIKSDRWTAKKREFLAKVKKHILSNPFLTPVDRDTFVGLIKENEELNKTIESLIDEKTGLENIIKDLERAKDKAEVKKIIKKHKPNNVYDEFTEIVNDLSSQLSKFSSIMRGIIFKEYTGKDVRIYWENYREYIDVAVAEDYINDDLKVDWYTTDKMRQLYDSLSKLSEILNSDYSEDFYESFKNEYKNVPLKIDNKSFWETVFAQNISF